MRLRSARAVPVLTLAMLGLGLTAFLACGGGGGGEEKEAAAATTADPPAKMEHVAFGEYVNPEDSLPHLRYFDGDQLSLNDRCAVRKVRLNPKMPPAYVNGRPVGFC